MRRGFVLAGMTIVSAFAVAQPASATIVYEHGREVWAMNDDGSDQRALAGGGPLGMEAGVGNPHVAPNGSTVVFEGSTNRNYHTCSGGVQYWGLHTTGVYRWSDGVVSRLSQSPAPLQCATSWHLQPEARTDGRVLNLFWSNASGNQIKGFQSGPQDGPSDSGSPTGCDNDIDLADPSPNPANPAQYVYLGCEGSGGSSAIALTQGSSHQGFSFDDAPQLGVGWRSDGGLVAAIERGTEPGIWTYTPIPGNANPVHVLNGTFGSDIGDDVSFAGAGNERILFASGGDIWSIPASCTAATCSFPGSATRLTTSGQNEDPSWTSASLRPASGGGTTGGGTTGGGTTGGGGPGTQGPITGGGGGGSVDLAALIQRSRVGSATSRGGVVFRIELAAPATLEFTFHSVKGRKVKKLGTVRKAGKAGLNRMTFKKVGRKKFRKGKYRAQIRAVANGQKGPAKTVNFTVKR
jgi:hypothetical protein